MTLCSSLSSLIKYIYLLLLSSSNILTYISIHPFIIFFTPLNPPIISVLLFISYDLSRLFFSFLWNLLTLYISTNKTIAISLFLLLIANFTFAFMITNNINFILVIVIRFVLGGANNVQSTYTNALSDMFSYGESNNIFEIASIINNVACIVFFTISLFIVKNFYIIIITIGIINTLAFILFTIKVFNSGDLKMGNKYLFQNNEEYHSKDRSNNNTQGNSLYNSNMKLRNPNGENINLSGNNNGINFNINLNFNNVNNTNLNSNGGNMNKSKSLDSALSKNFKHLNSDSIDNNLNNLNSINYTNSNNNNNIIKIVNINVNNNNFINLSNDKRKKNSINPNNSNNFANFSNLRYNFSYKNKKKNSSKSINQTITSPSMKQSYANEKAKLEKNIKKTFYVIIIYSLIQFIYTFSIFLFMMSEDKREKILLLFAVYYLFQIVFSPLNKKLINISVKSSRNKKFIFFISFMLSLLLSISFNLFYMNTIAIRKYKTYIIFISFLLRNETMTIMLSYCNINIFAESGAEKSMRKKKTISAIISSVLIIPVGYFFFEFNTLITQYIILYVMILLFLIIPFFIGIFFL